MMKCFLGKRQWWTSSGSSFGSSLCSCANQCNVLTTISIWIRMSLKEELVDLKNLAVFPSDLGLFKRPVMGCVGLLTELCTMNSYSGTQSAEVYKSQCCTAGEIGRGHHWTRQRISCRNREEFLSGQRFGYCLTRKVCSNVHCSGKMDSALRSSINVFRSQRHYFKEETKKLGLVNLSVCKWKGEIPLLSANRSREQLDRERGITHAKGQRVL